MNSPYFENIGLISKRLMFETFSKTLGGRQLEYFSFSLRTSPSEELDILFQKVIKDYGLRHIPIYRMCDAEYMYCLGFRLPVSDISLKTKFRMIFRSILERTNLINQRTWHGENYSYADKRRLKEKYISDLKQVASDGYLAPHLLLSEERFCEEYNEPIVHFFQSHRIPFKPDNYFPFYFVYIILSLKKYKRQLFEGKRILVVTSLNERKRRESFEAEFRKEGALETYFYEISATKSMMEVLDFSKLPKSVDIVLIGAGIGSANIINQLKHLNALCIDAGHALDCFSFTDLRKERVCLYPDEMFHESIEK